MAETEMEKSKTAEQQTAFDNVQEEKNQKTYHNYCLPSVGLMLYAVSCRTQTI